MKRLLVALLIGLVLLTTLVTGCGQVYLKADLDTAHEEGYAEGYASGKAEGYEAGFAEGREASLTQSEAETTPAPSVAPDKPTSSNQTSSPATEPASTPAPPPKPASFVLGDLTITPKTVKTGETVTISIPVTNTGGMEGSYTGLFAVKQVGGDAFEFTTLENIEITLNPEQTKTVTFTTTKSKSGTYTVGVNGEVLGQFTVTAPIEEPEEPEEPQVITGLAYIKASVRNYSDDADPESDGISVGISFYDSESKLIFASNVPLTVNITLYYLGQIPTSYPEGGQLLMYEDELAINYSMSQGIKIPFENLSFRSSKLTSFHQVEAQVTVTTPNQGDFSVTTQGIIDLN